jgi:ketosteroid isomerase-like protein
MTVRKGTAVENETDATKEILDLGAQWAAAELAGDTDTLAGLLADDFAGVGPRGFVLSKQGWLDRHAPGALRNDAFSWEDVQVRMYGDAAIVIGITDSKGSYAGQPTSGRARVTQVFVRDGARWAIAGMHLSGAPEPGAGPR